MVSKIVSKLSSKVHSQPHLSFVFGKDLSMKARKRSTAEQSSKVDSHAISITGKHASLLNCRKAS